MSQAHQLCSDASCTRPAAFTTRTRPAWCDDHITAILAEGRLTPLEPFAGPGAWRLTRCLDCGVDAHYRLDYTLDKNKFDQATCRACYWREWSRTNREMHDRYGLPRSPATLLAAAAELAESHGYAYLGALTQPSLPDDPHHVKCRYCGRVSVERLSDIAWGCQCQVNPKRSRPTPNVSEPRTQQRFKDSGAPAVAWWDHDRNTTADWETAGIRARRVAHWQCPTCAHRFTAPVADMGGPRCPRCDAEADAAWKIKYERYRGTPISDVPELLAQWADDADPRTVTVAGKGPVVMRRFRCTEGHHPRVSPLTFLTSGCPFCRAATTRAHRAQLSESDPGAPRMNVEIAAQWHPTRNGSAQLHKISPGSRRAFWWREPACGHEWQATPAQREKRERLRCPQCRTKLDSLAFHFPDRAAQWSADNPTTAWHVRPTEQTPFTPRWVCPKSHTWESPLASRAAGAECPECQEHGKSRVELDHQAAAEDAFGTAASGRIHRHAAFARRAQWSVDICVDLPDGQTLDIEYDGSYWHTEKTELDTEKSLDLLNAGHFLARLREHPLPPLAIDHPRYLELVVYSAAPDPTATIALVAQWVARGPRRA